MARPYKSYYQPVEQEQSQEVKPDAVEPVKVINSDEEISRLKEKLESSQKLYEIARESSIKMTEQLIDLREENEKLKEELSRLTAQTSPDEFVEIVADPVIKNVPVLPISYKGENVRMWKDERGYTRFMVPKHMACVLCSDKGGMPFRLVGPINMLRTKVTEGLYSKEVVIMRHELKTIGSETKWVEAVE